MSDDTTRLVETMVALRRSRPARFPSDLFKGDLGWDIVLALFVADANSVRVTARDVISQAGGNLESGERWMSYLSRQDLVAGDGTGRPDDVVTLTPSAIQAVEEWAEAMLKPLREFSLAELSRS